MKMHKHYKLAALSIKIKSLAAEASLIKHDEQAYKRRYHARNKAVEMDHTTFMQLKLHRIDVVRAESRSASLAYAFIRNVPYKTVERTSFKPIDKTRVTNLIAKFEPERDPDGVVNVRKRLEAWLAIPAETRMMDAA